MMIMAEVPRRKASRLLRCNEKTLASILSYWVNQAVEALDLSDVTKLAIDETSRKRGHDYVTITIDAMKRRVFDVQDDRKKEAVTAMRKKLERHGGKASNITAVTSDMSKSYLPGVRENFPDAEQIIDKFHVKKVLIDALDKVRKQEQKETNNKKELFLNRHFLMTPQSRMKMQLESLHPGVTLEEVLDNMGFTPVIPETIATTVEPTDEQIRVIREEIDPNNELLRA